MPLVPSQGSQLNPQKKLWYSDAYTKGLRSFSVGLTSEVYVNITHSTHMKHIFKLDRGKYVHLDSYGKPKELPLGAAFIWCIVFGISLITISSLLGTDVTKPTQIPTQPTQPLKP